MTGRRPRVLLGALSCSAATGGAALSSMFVADMIGTDCDVTILTGSNETSRTNVRELRIGPVRAAVPLLVRIPTGLLGLRRQARQVLEDVRPDLIHLQDANLLDPVVPLARAMRIPVVVTLRDLLFVPSFGQGEFDANGSRRPEWWARGSAFLGLMEGGRAISWVLPLLLPWLYAKPAQQRQLMEHATLLLPVSQYVKDELLRCGVTAPSEVMRLEPIPEWPMLPPREAAGIRFLAMGRMVEGKGFEVLLHAFSRVLAAKPNATLTLGGRGPLFAELTALAGRLGCARQVTFPGHVAFNELERLYNDADIVVVPSTHPETTGRVALEAAMIGRPVIAARSGGLVEAVGPRGVLVTPGDVDQLAREMLALADDRPRQVALAVAARQDALNYTAPRLRQELLALYDRLLAR